MRLTRRSFGSVLLAAAAAPAFAQTATPGLPAPKGRVILTVSGKIGVRNDGETAKFDRDMLEALGQSSFTTSTPWYDAPTKFEGVPMARLLAAVQASGETAIASALNDYETRIPISDFQEFNVLLALKRDGEYMPVRDKGPLFIIYPFDSNPALKTQKYYSRSAWQLARLMIA